MNVSKPFYADYVNHMIRTYARLHPAGDLVSLSSPVDAANYHTVDRVLGALEEADRHRVLTVLGSRGSIAQRVEEVAAQSALPPAVIWTLVARVSADLARHRQLI
jgi:hypothetical protein